jgi:hypothetical protein
MDFMVSFGIHLPPYLFAVIIQEKTGSVYPVTALFVGKRSFPMQIALADESAKGTLLFIKSVVYL